MAKCLKCGKALKQLPGKRPKKYCNSTCRSGDWAKAARAARNADKPKKEPKKKKSVAGKKVKHAPKVKKIVNKPGDIITSDTIISPESTFSQPQKPVKVKDLTQSAPVYLSDPAPVTNYSIDTRPKNLAELKAQCDPSLKGFERSLWISEARKKYSI